MKPWIGNDGKVFTLSFVDTSNLEDEMHALKYALKNLKAIKISFHLTSIDSFEEEYIVGKSRLRLESTSWDNAIHSEDKNVILLMKDIIEKI